jgi:allantoin racemase
VRILLVNANTSTLVTDKVMAGAHAIAAPGTELVGVTGTFGARVIGTRAEHAIAEHSTIALAARHAPGFDAIVIAVSYDTGARGARELLPVPVVGMTEAGLLTACMLGGRIGMIVFGKRVLPLYRELVDSYGLASRVAGWRVLESTAPYGRGEHPELDAQIAATARDLVERDCAEAIIVTGAVMAGVPGRIQHAVPVPVIDCIEAGVRQAELLARMRLPKPTAGSYASPAGREMVAVDEAIVRAFAAPGAGTP